MISPAPALLSTSDRLSVVACVRQSGFTPTQFRALPVKRPPARVKSAPSTTPSATGRRRLRCVWWTAALLSRLLTMVSWSALGANMVTSAAPHVMWVSDTWEHRRLFRPEVASSSTATAARGPPPSRSASDASVASQSDRLTAHMNVLALSMGLSVSLHVMKDTRRLLWRHSRSRAMERDSGPAWTSIPVNLPKSLERPYGGWMDDHGLPFSSALCAAGTYS